MTEVNYNKLKSIDEYSFENYFADDFNKLAFESVKSLIPIKDNKLNNLLFIYGEIGLGKTHLVNALINKLTDNDNSSLYYSDCATFSASHRKSVIENDITVFDDYICSHDSFVLENIEDLSGKNKTQEKVQQLLNHFINNKKLVIVTSSQKPNNLIEYNEKLKSILLSNVIACIKTPSYNERLKYIQFKAEQYELNLADIKCSSIAENTADDFRIINGILRTFSRYKQAGCNISDEIVMNLLEDVI